MNTQHIPGHWGQRQHTGNNSRVIIGQDLSPIGVAYELPDARLIAAAPELLAALERIAAGDPMHASFNALAISEARAAIAKTTGDA